MYTYSYHFKKKLKSKYFNMEWSELVIMEKIWGAFAFL